MEFVFPGNGFSLVAGESNSTQFDIENASGVVDFSQQLSPDVYVPGLLSFDITQCQAFPTIFTFIDDQYYTISEGFYTPSNVFDVPQICETGIATEPEVINEGVGYVELESPLGIGTGFYLRPVNRTLIREPVCAVQEETKVVDILAVKSLQLNALVANQSACSMNTNALPYEKALCSTAENADHLEPAFCANQDNVIRMPGNRLCAPFENAIPTNSNEHQIVQSLTTPMGLYICAPRQNAIPTNSTGTCSNQQYTGDQIYHHTKLVHPASGAPYTPSNTFEPDLYESYSVIKTTKHVFADRTFVFNLDNGDPSPVFNMSEYTTTTFPIPIVFWPTNQTYESASMVDRPYNWIIGESIYLTIDDGRMPLRVARCDRSSDGLLMFDHRCSIQEQAVPPGSGVSQWVDPLPDVDPEPPGGGTTITVPTKEVYTVKNTITTTLADLTPIDITNISISFNADSHSWQWSGDLANPEQANMLKPAANGTGVIIYVTINTKTWHLLVEKSATTRTFNSKIISLGGRGIGALLSEEYLSKESVTTTSLLSNVQIAESFLPLGWSLTWGIATWNIPAGSYSHQNLSPLQALNEFVKSCGGMIVPKTDGQVFEVIKRYPVLPWNFTLVAPDLIIPDDIVTELTEEPVSTYGANAVHVHGLEGGKQAVCRITGTAGDRLATTVSSNVITDIVAVRAAGERALAGAYPQPKTKSVATIMDGGTTIDLVEPGVFVEFDIDGGTDRGVVNGVTISANTSASGLVTVGQTIVIGESTISAFSIFKKLLPSDPLLLVKLISTDGSTSLVEQVDGVQTRVRGTGTVNTNYYVKGGKLDGDAPAVTLLSEVVV